MSEPRPRSRTRLDPAVRRRQIAEAAARVFAEHDPSEVSFELIADEAGVSRSLVYSYFGDRGSLFAAAYNHELERLDTEIDGALESLGSDRERLARAVSAYLGFAWRHRTSWQLIASASSSRHPAVREAIQARTDRIAASITDTAEARLLVRGVIGMLEAAAIHTLENDDADPQALAELLTQIIWDGVSSLDGVERADGDRARRTRGGPPLGWLAMAKPYDMQIDLDTIYEVTIESDKGTIVAELDPQLAPKTVNEFVSKARDGFYDGLTFHRVVPNFVIQGGDPDGTGRGGPGYRFEDEPVKGEYTLGAFAMANAGPNTNGSQFFICIDDCTGKLDKLYNLFGYVTQGMDNALAIQVGDKMNTVSVAEKPRT